MELRKCKWCGEVKPLNDFPFRNDRQVYYVQCKECERKRGKLKRIKEKEEFYKDGIKYYENWHCINPNCNKPLEIRKCHKRKGIPTGHSGCHPVSEETRQKIRVKIVINLVAD